MNDIPTSDLETRVRALVADLDLPHPGEGHTAERWRALAAIARHDVTEGRVIEAHVDALSILHEAGLEPERGALYGVWAAEEPGRALELDGDRVRGRKPFCTGPASSTGRSSPAVPRTASSSPRSTLGTRRSPTTPTTG